MNVFFITGTSRGIGKAIAELLLEDENNFVWGIARHQSITHERYKHVEMDLSDVQKVLAWKFPELENAKKIALINNAGAIGEVRHAGNIPGDVIVKDYHVNLVSPSILTNEFVKTYAAHPAVQVIINVSSGAGKNPIDGWSIYCATKAGLDHFTRTVAEEVKISGRKNLHVFSVAPGIVDTAMQDQIRESSVKDFSRVSQFVDYKKNGQLADARLVARKYLSILVSPEKFQDAVFSVKDI